MNDVYNRLREFRRAKELTQAEIAEKLKLTPVGYGKLERGDVQLTIERAYELATIFGVSVVELLGEGASVVVAGANDSTKELEAMKQKILSLEKDLEMEKMRSKLGENSNNMLIMRISYLLNLFLPFQANQKLSSEDYFFLAVFNNLIISLLIPYNEYEPIKEKIDKLVQKHISKGNPQITAFLTDLLNLDTVGYYPPTDMSE